MLGLEVHMDKLQGPQNSQGFCAIFPKKKGHVGFGTTYATKGIGFLA